jgi:hypothetical protein
MQQPSVERDAHLPAIVTEWVREAEAVSIADIPSIRSLLCRVESLKPMVLEALLKKWGGHRYDPILSVDQQKEAWTKSSAGGSDDVAFLANNRATLGEHLRTT